MDVNRRIQLDAEELRLYVELKRVKDSELALKEQVAKMEAEFEQEKTRADRLAEHSRTVISKNETLDSTHQRRNGAEAEGSRRKASLRGA